MIIGTPYIVAKASDDGTFHVGDQVVLEKDGSISCLQAEGWIDAKDVPEATAGWEIAIDTARIERRRQKLQSQLDKLNCAHEQPEQPK